MIRIHPADDVVIARVPPGHKLAVRAIAQGEPARRYDQIIGTAAQPVAAGQHVHSHNLAFSHFARDDAAGTGATPTQCVDTPATFMGIRRADGCIATRNYIGRFWSSGWAGLRGAQSPAIADKLIRRIEWRERYTARNDQEMDNNPSAGNKVGGLPTILEKSPGAIAKSGATNLVNVFEYAQPGTVKGLVFMDTPGYDPVSAPGQVAGGAHRVGREDEERSARLRPERVRALGAGRRDVVPPPLELPPPSEGEGTTPGTPAPGYFRRYSLAQIRSSSVAISSAGAPSSVLRPRCWSRPKSCCFSTA